MITYLPDDPLPGGKFSISYQSLRDDYLRYRLMSDDEFMGDLLNVLHFACVTCWLKELQTQWVLSDTGIVHELVHLLCDERERSGKNRPENIIHDTDEIAKIRELFNEQCCLA